MTLRSILVQPEESGRRLDVLIAGLLPEASRVAVARAISEGRVRVSSADGRARRVRPSLAVQHGDRIEVDLGAPRPPAPHLVPESVPLDIVYQDDDLLVVNKPSGMPVHPGAGRPTGTLVHALLAHTAHLSHGSSPERPGIVHRLDKDTSGLLLVARSDDAHRRLAAQIAARSVHRTYRALVWGVPRTRTGRIEAAVGRDPRNRQRMAVVARGGKPAVTRYRIEGAYGNVCEVVAELETGRTHQIRVHMAHLGHPIVGDAVYGGRERAAARWKGRAVLDQAPRQMLHAWRIAFTHPRTGGEMLFTAEPPADYAAAVRAAAECAHGR